MRPQYQRCLLCLRKNNSPTKKVKTTNLLKRRKKNPLDYQRMKRKFLTVILKVKRKIRPHRKRCPLKKSENLLLYPKNLNRPKTKPFQLKSQYQGLYLRKKKRKKKLTSPLNCLKWKVCFTPVTQNLSKRCNQSRRLSKRISQLILTTNISAKVYARSAT